MKKNLSMEMIPLRIVIVFTSILVIITSLAISSSGPTGVLIQAFSNFESMQLFIDLVIALMLFMFFIWHETKDKVHVFFIWLVITIVIGSFGPLLYLLIYHVKRKKEMSK